MEWSDGVMESGVMQGQLNDFRSKCGYNTPILPYSNSPEYQIVSVAIIDHLPC
jgi:hypothetical protein